MTLMMMKVTQFVFGQIQKNEIGNLSFLDADDENKKGHDADDDDRRFLLAERMTRFDEGKEAKNDFNEVNLQSSI